jgi:hypothetical protein
LKLATQANLVEHVTHLTAGPEVFDVAAGLGLLQHFHVVVEFLAAGAYLAREPDGRFASTLGAGHHHQLPAMEQVR